MVLTVAEIIIEWLSSTILVSSEISSVQENYSVYKCVTCRHGTTFLPSKIQCVAVATFTIYMIVFMLFPSLLCHSRIPPSVEYRYIGQTNAEVCQYPDLSDPAPAGEICQHKCCHVSQSLH